MGLFLRPNMIALCGWLLLWGWNPLPNAGWVKAQELPVPLEANSPQGQPIPLAQPVPLFQPPMGSFPPIPGFLAPALNPPVLAAPLAPIAAPSSVVPNWPLSTLLPTKVRVGIHYAIKADRLGRVVLYRNLMNALTNGGFERDHEDDPDPIEPENANHVLLTGVLPSASLDLVANLSAVRSLVLTPVEYDLAKAGENPVRVELMLGRGSTRLLQDTSPATHKALEGLGFKESVIYDTYRGTRLLGSIPANQVMKIGTKLGQPIGLRTESAPFQPVLVVWVDGSSPLPSTLAPAAEVPAGFSKVAPELRKPLAEPGKVFRVELLFDRPFANQAEAMEGIAKLSPSLVFESLLGSSVTVIGTSEDLRALANDPKINAIRPGPVAHSGSLSAGFQPEGWAPMGSSPLGAPNRVVIGGKTLRDTVVLIEDDFRGMNTLPGWKEGKIQAIDLTRERDPQLVADPYRGAVNEIGRGTLLAKNLLATQPNLRLVLIRIDPSVPAMIQRVAKAIQGDSVLTDELMAQRLNEIRQERLALTEERGALEKDWKDNGDDFGEEAEALRKRKEYQDKLKAIKQKEMAHHQRLERYLAHQKGLQALKEVRLVLCPLVWNEGLPRGGASSLSRWFDDRPFRGALWVQSAGDRPGQTWSGMFRDHDKNGVMEWSDLPAGKDAFPGEEMPIRWRSADGTSTSANIPVGTRIRVTIQWREPRDPYQSEIDRDSGRTPVADLKVRLVKVENVPGKADPRLAERTTVAQPVGPALLIDHTRQSAVFESFVDLEVVQGGRYEARIEGIIPDSVIPRSSPHLPINKVRPEIHPVIWLKTMGANGNAVWASSGDQPVVGVPGDAQQVLSVGSSGSLGQFPRVFDPSNLIDRSDAKPDLILTGEAKSSADAVLGAAAALLPIIHPDQDVRYWKRTLALPPGLTRVGSSAPVSP